MSATDVIPSGMIPAVLIGAGVGFLSGLFGKGGSAVTTPALRVLMHVPRFSALASPLPVTIPTTLAAGFAYRGRHLIDWFVVILVSALGIPATIIGSLLSPRVGGHPLMLMTALFVLSLGLTFVIGDSHHNREAEPDSQTAAALPFTSRLWLSFSIGAGVGLLSGLLANSGGILFGPLFIRLLRLQTKKAFATSLVVSAVLAVPGTIAHWKLGHIDWTLVTALSCGSIPFSFLGGRLAMSLRSKTLERLYGVALVLFGLYDLLWTERALLHIG